MNETENLEKRIKRHVQGKPQSFFVSTLPGLESICFDEFVRLGVPRSNTRTGLGGIEFDGRVHDAYLANLQLRTATRILMRLFTFTATNFRQLEKKLTEFPWELYVSKKTACEVNVTSRRSRLIHTHAIAERFQTSLENRLSSFATPVDENPASPAAQIQQIFVRAENDQFTVSIDSSGDLLHKRGVKIQGGKAPIRETFAAAILYLAGYHPGSPLIDPMCGTGTFSLEAAMITRNIPAGWYREFAFMNWPAFKPSRWKHIRREAEKKMTPISEPMIFASDIDPENSRQLEHVVSENHLSDTISVCSSDFFDLHPRNMHVNANHPGLITLNPPYGRRLGHKDTADKLFADICKKLKNDFKGWKAAILVPDRRLLKKIPFKPIAREFLHGGLKITLATGRIP